MFYKTTISYYSPASEPCIFCNDSCMNIEWQLAAAPILSAKDAVGAALQSAELFD
jgi:dTDP-4-dehydrorhamnose 3,5-epimerase